MSEQQTQPRDDQDASSGAGDADTGQQSGQQSGQRSGQQGEGSGDATTETSSGGSGSSGGGSGGGTDDQPARRSENHPKPQQPSESDRAVQEQQRSRVASGEDGGRGEGDEHRDPPEGGRRRSSIDVSELAWKAASVLATVVRVVALLFAAALVLTIVLRLVGVNPANGVASAIGTVGDTVVLGFRDLFLPADPVFLLVVNYGLAAVFWVLVGEFVSRLIRFLGARIS